MGKDHLQTQKDMGGHSARWQPQPARVLKLEVKGWEWWLMAKYPRGFRLQWPLAPMDFIKSWYNCGMATGITQAITYWNKCILMMPKTWALQTLSVAILCKDIIFCEQTLLRKLCTLKFCMHSVYMHLNHVCSLYILLHFTILTLPCRNEYQESFLGVKTTSA
jgi:hypothetical protein